MVNKNEYGSVIPLLVVFAGLIICGLVIGVISLFMAPIMNQDNTINTFMSYSWTLIIPIAVIVAFILYSIVKNQRPGVNF